MVRFLRKGMESPIRMAELLPASYRRFLLMVILHPARQSLGRNPPLIYPTRTIPLNQYSPAFRASQERLCRTTTVTVLGFGFLFQVIVRLGRNEQRSSREMALASADTTSLFVAAE
jgi:hypothetical protein